MKHSTFWKQGDQTRLAKAAGMVPANLNLVLHRKRGVSWPVAKRLEAACYPAIGRNIQASVWMDSRVSDHPAFFGRPLRKAVRK